MTTPLRPLAVHALGIAIGYANAGTHEIGGDNRGDEVEFFQRMAGAFKGAPWCCAFVLTCLVKAFAQLAGLDEDRASLIRLVPRFCSTYGIPRTAYCPTMWAALKRLGLTRGPHADVPAGALVFFDWDGQGEPHHIGFVAAHSGQDQALSTIEGNTSSGEAGSQADGGGVFARSRGRGHVYGFAVAA